MNTLVKFLIVITLTTLTACAGQNLKLEDMNTAQARAYLAALQDVRFSTLELAADLYVSGSISPDTYRAVESADAKFRAHWGSAADAVDLADMLGFAKSAGNARQSLDDMAGMVN